MTSLTKNSQLQNKGSELEKELSSRIQSFTDKLKSCASDLNGLSTLLPRRSPVGYYKTSPQQPVIIGPQGSLLFHNNINNLL